MHILHRIDAKIKHWLCVIYYGDMPLEGVNHFFLKWTMKTVREIYFNFL